MSERVERAVNYFSQGYGCGQAVMCAYCDLVGLEPETALKISEGLGLGLGRQLQTCGAVSAMALLAGMKNSDGNLEEGPKTKKATYALVKELGDAFKEKNGSISCGELTGFGGRPKLRSCAGCVEDAAEILEEKLFQL